MEKKFKTQPEPYLDDDLHNDELYEDSDFDDDMDFYLNKQKLLSADRGSKGRRSGRYHDDARAYGSSHRLPSDWKDFDYTAGAQYQDDWR